MRGKVLCASAIEEVAEEAEPWRSWLGASCCVDVVFGVCTVVGVGGLGVADLDL